MALGDHELKRLLGVGQAAVSPAASASESIDRDCPCVRCGYNLRSLKRRTLCPECGAPVERSMGESRLCFADPAWLRRLRSGVRLMLASVVLRIVGSVVEHSLESMSAPSSAADTIRLIGLMLVVAGSAMNLWALAMLTSPDPADRRVESPVCFRNVVLASAGCVIVSNGIDTIGLRAGIGWTIALAGLVLGLVGLVSVVGELIYLRRFAIRLPDEALAAQTQNVLYGLPMFFGIVRVMALVLLLMMPGGAGAPSAGQVGLVCFLGIMMIGLLVFSVWYLVLLIRFNGAFSQAYEEASAMPIATRARQAVD